MIRSAWHSKSETVMIIIKIIISKKIANNYGNSVCDFKKSRLIKM